ncbi:efflux RND transporter periplasmic adaptor subunit [Gemmata sp.]|uniref:efflux RND transporter periplasmic adaptor subunit n=1 Tax=Gemmata sp. TaxID=1914242 RepID=UPI003F707554
MSRTFIPPRWSRLPLAVLLAAGAGAAGWATFGAGKSHGTDHPADAAGAAAVPSAEVVSPQPGGLPRMCVQPGSVEPFETAEVYAKASGFLVEQSVDIGSRVTKGQVLARLSVPEFEKQVDRDAARAKAATAKVHQMEAHVLAAEAEAKAATAAVAFAMVSVRAKASYRKYREKQLERIRELVAQKAIEVRLLDEQEDYYLSALESENAAKESVNSSEQRATAAASKVIQARADLEEAQASTTVALAELERSKVFRDYTVVRSPYTGVVTKRNFHPGQDGQLGDFIRSADQGGSVPLFTVERTDVVRVVVQVPDRDVPFVSPSSTATVEIDALPGVVFGGTGAEPLKVSRWAKSQDAATRTMRVEIDVKNPTDAENPDGVLQRGMYGKATLVLRPGTAASVRVPSLAVVGRETGGRGAVRVVRGDRIQTVPVTLGTDNGREIEVTSGLTAADRVVLRTTSPVDDGAQVAVSGARAATVAAGH